MKKQPEITAQTKENLTEAFWILYCKKKIDSITVKDITDKAGYHRSTFYEYFVDIYDVLNQLEDSLVEYIKVNGIESGEINLPDEDLTQKVAAIYEVKGKYLSVLLSENGDPHFANKIKSIMRPIVGEVFKLSESNVQALYIFEFAFSAIIATITHWYRTDKNIPSQEMAFLVRSMLMQGVYPVVQKLANEP